MEILFRGKRVDNGEWVYGDFYRKFGVTGLVHDYMISTRDGMAYQVIPETVGQYTGHNDKNGNRIFDGDILKDSLGWVCLVKWDDSNGRFLGYHKKPRGDTYVCYVGREPAQEVIENIHDNPELMESE